MNDTNQYPNSIFYQQWHCTTAYASLDETLIKYILNKKMEAGMRKDEALKIIEELGS